MKIIGFEMDYCICTPCNKGEHENCLNQFCFCNKFKTVEVERN